MQAYLQLSHVQVFMHSFFFVDLHLNSFGLTSRHPACRRDFRLRHFRRCCCRGAGCILLLLLLEARSDAERTW
jgi:hypothetical protein